MKSNASAAYAFFLLVGDFVAILLAFALAYILRVTLSDLPFRAIYANDYARVFILLTPVWLIIFSLLGLYSRDTYEWRWREATRLFIGSIIGIMGVISYGFIADKTILPARIVALYGFIIAFALLYAERTILRWGRKLSRRFGFGLINTMIIGDGANSREMLRLLKDSIGSGYRVVALISQTIKPPKGVRHFTSLEHGLAEIDRLDVHNIILTELFKETEKNSLILSSAQEHHCGFRFVPGQEGLISSRMEVELFQGMPVVSVQQTPLSGWGRIVKRLFDIFAAVVGIVVLSPLMLLIYLVLLIVGGKPIYRRKRLTRFGGHFDIYKFRSLKSAYNGLDPEDGFAKMGRPDLALKFRANGDFLENDPRVSRLGSLLRSTSLDELPQLFNILRGDISLVGPRALIAEELNNYPYKNLILSVKSGLTGLAQISGRKDLPFEERRKLDLYYVQNWSFWLDIKILLRTFLEIAKRSGAR